MKKYKALEHKKYNQNDHDKIWLFEKYKLYEEENVKNEEFEKPVSFRDNLVDKFDKLECDSEFDYEKFEQKLNQQKKHSEIENFEDDKPKIKKFAKWYDKDEIMKMFDHIESELNYNQYFNNTKNKQSNNIVLLQDEEQRIWEIKRKDNCATRNFASLSSLKSLDSPVSISSDNLRFSMSVGKNKTAVHNFVKLSFDRDQDNLINQKETESDVVDGGYQVTLKWDFNNDHDWHIIDYQVVDVDEEEKINMRNQPSLESSTKLMEINYFDLY